jgi:hypothetical protein
MVQEKLGVEQVSQVSKAQQGEEELVLVSAER